MKRMKPWVVGVGLCAVMAQSFALELTPFTFTFEQTGTPTEIAAIHLTPVGLLTPALSFAGFNYLVEGQSRDPGQTWFDQDGLSGTSSGVAIGLSGITGSITPSSAFLGITEVTFRFSTSGFNTFSPSPTTATTTFGSNNDLTGANKPECSNGTADAVYCNWTTATITFAAPISSLSFLSNAGANTFIFSDMSITLASNSMAPVPEPSTYALMVLGLAGIGMFSRRRRKET